MSESAIEQARPDDWERVRAVRLAALADAPDAFTITLAEDVAKPLETWRQRLERSDAATFLATRDGRDVGCVVGAPYEGQPGNAGLFAMWVAPDARGHGIAGRLVDAVVSWARTRGYRRVLLGVGDYNVGAIRLYESRGFLPTGVRFTLPPPRAHITEHERALDLAPERGPKRP
jgi:GNAT superfamily N-acetyltransferase